MAVLLSYALTNVSDVKELLGIPSSNHTYDNLIIRMINKATLAIESYCDRRFKATDYTDEEYDGTGTDQLILRQRPIIGTVTLGSRDTSLNQGDFDSIDSELFFTNTQQGMLNLNFNAVGSWNRYQVSYRAGYETIPDDIAEACASLAAYYVSNANTSNVGVTSKREGQRQVSYANGGQMPSSFETIISGLGIDTILNSYRDYQVGAV